MTPDAQRVVQAWNDAATLRGYHHVTTLKGERAAALRARLAEPGWVETAIAAIAYVRDERYYSVEHPEYAKFDVLIRPGKAEWYVEQAAVRPGVRVAKSHNGAREATDRAGALARQADPTLGMVKPEDLPQSDEDLAFWDELAGPRTAAGGER